ncbi:hypothetical protein [Mesobacillus subterraneus]|uniref:hypothetical protein n=1 Tax=Mesobacillus subterraneus TaxID=285983 RepID=UPI001CFE90CB|nr:hypothetical protein [Mesobacillus subterraneus]
MEKVRMQPFIILSLILSSITMALYAYRNFANQELGYGIVFTALFLFLIGMALYGFIRNQKMKSDSKGES